MTQTATVVGKVEYRQGDGANAPIRRGPIDVETTQTDATLSWTDGESHANAAIPLADFKRYLADGAIKMNS